MPAYQLSNNGTLIRKPCTLAVVAPKLLEFISSNNFNVSYTLIPYTGVSMIDFRFRLGKVPTLASFLRDLNKTLNTGQLRDLYTLVKSDQGPAAHKFTHYSAVLVESGIRFANDNLYIPAYFDNENSVNRYYDLIQYMTGTLNPAKPIA
jgi:glyceraldehyde 3-phosphate dehydrogenase